MQRIFTRHMVALCWLVCVSTPVLAQWVWREGGTTVHSDRPPPPNIPASQIIKQPAGSNVQMLPSAAPANNTAPAPNKDSKPKTAAELDAEFKERRNKKAEEDKKAAEDAQKKQQTTQECERARSYLKALQDGLRIRTGKDNAMMEDAERQKELQRVQQQIGQSCK